MVEKCGYCGATFKVYCIGGGGFSGACNEPIDCPYCKKTVREDRTTGTYTTELIKAPESELSEYLGITDEEWLEMDVELNANTGNSGEMVYSYWFEVPENINESVADKTGWKRGEVISGIPAWIVDQDQEIG